MIIWSNETSITVLVLPQELTPVATGSASDYDLVPPSPDNPFASMVTLQDLREQDANRVRLPPELDELVPPSAPGELGLTVAEFEAMVEAQPPRSQNKELGITDLVPPN